MKTKLVAFIFIFPGLLFGQIDDFNFKRNINGVQNEWHKLQIPDEVFGKLRSNFQDLRFYGITVGKDTIEVPYIVKQLETLVTAKEVKYTVLSVDKIGKEYHYVFRFENEQNIDEIKLEFGRNSYDWNVAVDGSQDGKRWNMVVEDYRLLSIRNEYMNYLYETIDLPKSPFKYIRIRIPEESKPTLILPKMFEHDRIEGASRNYKPIEQKSYQKSQDKESVIDIELKHAVPVNQVKLNVEADYDYYRNIYVEYLYDSTKTKDGFKYNYMRLGQGTLSSLENNSIRFQEIVAKKFRLRVSNYDNEPLPINVIDFSGYAYEVKLRFTDPLANYFMVYGNKEVSTPNYDITHFKNKIPSILKGVNLGQEIYVGGGDRLKTNDGENEKPLFSNKWWLYSLMGIIILVLGIFTIKMMKSVDKG